MSLGDPKLNMGKMKKKQTMIFLKTNNCNTSTCINGTNYHFDTEIQACTNEDPKFQSFTKAALE